MFENLNLSLEGYYLLHEDAYFDLDSMTQDDRLIMLHAPGTLQIFEDLPRTAVSFL